jgi:hypothetical protein
MLSVTLAASLPAIASATICQERVLAGETNLDVDFIDNDHRFNLDDNNGLDVVVCDTCATQNVVDLGTGMTIWTFDAGTLGFGPVDIVAFADLDDDGTREVVLQCQGGVAPPGGGVESSCTNSIIVYDWVAEQVDLSLGTPEMPYSVEFVGDVDGDGLDELVAVGVDAMQQVTALVFGSTPCNSTAVQVTDLSSTSTPDGILLSWHLSEDPMSELLGIQVQRADAPEGPYEAVSPVLSEMDVVMSYTDIQVQDARTYWYRLLLMRQDGTQVTSRPSGAVLCGAPAEVDLRIAHNPADAGPVEVRYRLTRPRSQVRLSIYDVRGRTVRLLDMGPRGAGEWVESWDRLDSLGRPVARGVYLMQLDLEDVMISRKVVLFSR